MPIRPKTGYCFIRRDKPRSLSSLLEVPEDVTGSPEKGVVVQAAPKDFERDLFDVGDSVMFFTHRAASEVIDGENLLVVPMGDVVAVVED